MVQDGHIVAYCPNSQMTARFKLIDDRHGTLAWCTHCRRVWPLDELVSGQFDLEGRGLG